MSPSKPPCAACKLKRQKCTKECAFAPYFPPDQPKKFASIYEVFGAKNIAKLLNELNAAQREDAVNSLAYEAEERLRDPIYGCVGLIYILQHQLKQIQSDLQNARTELATYIGPQAMIPMIHQTTPFMSQQYMGASSSSTMLHHQHGMMPVHGGSLIIREPHLQRQHHHHLHPHHHQQQQILEAQQQLAIAMGAPREQHDMIRASELQQQYQHQQVQQQQIQQKDFFRFNYNEFEASGSGSVKAAGFNQIGPSQPLALGPNYDNPYQNEPEQQQLQTQLLFQPQENQLLQLQMQQEQQMTHQTQQRTGSDERRRSVGPSC